MSLVVATPGIDSVIGFEEAARGALKLLIDGLDEEVERRSERWAEADLDWQEFAGLGIAQVDVDPVALGNFHEGPHQSVVKAPMSAFPAVSVMSYFASPAPREFDGVEKMALRLAVETFCASGPVIDESLASHEVIVHRRLTRTTEAVNQVLMRDRTLCGTVQPGIVEGPRGGPAPRSFVRREEDGTGPTHIWHGSRLEYTLQRHAMF